MGITGLLPQLQSIQDPVHISAYAGRRVAADAYSWLHKGAFSCATQLCLGQPTRAYVSYCMGRVNLMRSHGVTPIVVFDGARLPIKQNTESDRLSTRERNKARGLECYKSGKAAAATKYFQKAVDVTPLMAFHFIEELKKAGVEFVVAPYEADAQLAWLSKAGLVDAVVSEDSDLLVFGCKRVLFKMDKDGNGQEICLSKLGYNTTMSFYKWTHQRFQQMCVLSGCDYLPSVPRVGIKGAYNLCKAVPDAKRAIAKLRFRQEAVPQNYERDFARAMLAFQHQLVYDTRAQRLVHLTPVPDAVRNEYESLDFLGPMLSDSVARRVAEGLVDPDTHEPFPASVERSRSAPSLSSRTGASESMDEVKALAPLPLAAASSSSSSSSSFAAVSNTKKRPKKKRGSLTPVPMRKMERYFVPQTPAVVKDFVAPKPSTKPMAAKYPPSNNPLVSQDVGRLKLKRKAASTTSSLLGRRSQSLPLMKRSKFFKNETTTTTTTTGGPPQVPTAVYERQSSTLSSPVSSSAPIKLDGEEEEEEEEGSHRSSSSASNGFVSQGVVRSICSPPPLVQNSGSGARPKLNLDKFRFTPFKPRFDDDQGESGGAKIDEEEEEEEEEEDDDDLHEMTPHPSGIPVIRFYAD